MPAENNNQPDPATPEHLLAAARRQLPKPMAAEVARAMQQLGAANADDLALIVADRDVERARSACWLLGELGAKRHVWPLVAALREERPELWSEAAVALSRLESKRAVGPLLRQMACGRAVEQREAAAYALAFMFGVMRDAGYTARMSAAFIAVLTDRAEAPAVRAQAAEGLGNLHNMDDQRRRVFRQALRALLDALNDPAAEVRFWACFALGGMRARSALPALRHLAVTDATLLPDWWTVGEEAADAIDWIEGRVPPERNRRGL
jgi:HEAT repeat protein